MKKKVILSSLLVSTTLLGASTMEAASSKLKKESKIVTVSNKKAKLYKDSKLKSAKKPKVGTVYKVDGSRLIKNKTYYRVYQEDSKGKLVYKGYLVNKDTKTVVAKKLKSKKVYVKKGSPLYKSVFLTKSTKEKKDKAEYTTKTYYVINGKKYYSVSKGKKFVGYVSEKSLTKAPAKKPAKPNKPAEKPEVAPEVKPETKPETPEQKPSQDENKQPEVTPEVKPEVKPEEKPSTPSQDEDKNEPSKEEDKTPSKDENNKPAEDKDDYKQPSKPAGSTNTSKPSTDKKDPVKEDNKKPAGNKDEGKQPEKPSTPSKDEGKKPSTSTDNKKPSTDKKDPVKEDNKKPAGNKDEGKQPAKPSTPSKDEGKAPAKPAEKPNKNDKPAGSTSTSKPSKEEDKKEPEKKPETQKPTESKPKPEVKPEQKPVAPSQPVAPKPEPKPEPTPEPVRPAPTPEQTPSKPAEENKVQSITTSGLTLKDPNKLSKAIVDSSFATSTAKKLAKLFAEVATPVWTYSTGEKGGNNLGLEITLGWSNFDGHGNGDYTKAFQLLQKYAKDVKSVSDEELNAMMDKLVMDFQDMRVITTKLQEAVNDVKGKLSKLSKSTSSEDLVKQAEECIRNPKLDNWKKIVTLTGQLQSKAKDLQKQIDSQKAESSKVKPITTDRKILNNPTALCKTILSSKTTAQYAQVERLARVMQYAAAVWAYASGEQVIYTDLGFELLGVSSGVNSGLEINSAWTKFEGNGRGDYYKAIKLLQDFAKNPDAIDAQMTNITSVTNAIISELGGMRVSPVALHQAVQKAEAKLKKSKDESLEKLVFEAKQIITDSYGTNRGLGNWKHIVELTKKIQEATK